MILATDKQVIVALIAAMLATSLFASVGALSAFGAIVVIAFGPSIVFLHLWKEMLQMTTHRLEIALPSAYMTALRRRAHVATALVASRRRKRRGRKDLGWMSAQWVAEHRASDR